MAHVLGIVLGADQVDARPAAALDLIFQTGAGTIVEDGVLALAHREDLLQQVQGLADGVAADEGTEEAILALGGAAMKGQARKGVGHRQADVGVALVVTQQDVEARLQGLDEIVLQQQGLALGAGHGDLDVPDEGHHDLDAPVVGPAEIAGDAALEVLGLADVEHFASAIQHAVDPGGLGEGLQQAAGIARLLASRQASSHANLKAGHPPRLRDTLLAGLPVGLQIGIPAGLAEVLHAVLRQGGILTGHRQCPG